MLFVFFSGESYDYMGSQRFLYDMENGEFPLPAEEAGDLLPQIRPENISLFIEFSQLSHSGGVYAHILENTEVSFVRLSTNSRPIRSDYVLTNACLHGNTNVIGVALLFLSNQL